MMLHTAETATCPILNQAGNFHFEGCCEDCNARYLGRCTLEQVEDRYHTGRIDQDQFEAYMFTWATGAFRYSTLGDGWTDPPTDPTVRRIVRKILRDRGRPVPGALVDCLPARYVTVAGGHVIDLDADETLSDDNTEQFEPGYLS